jgi:hypothetical protein
MFGMAGDLAVLAAALSVPGKDLPVPGPDGLSVQEVSLLFNSNKYFPSFIFILFYC